MSIDVHLFTKENDSGILLEAHPPSVSVEQALEQLRQHWNEETGNQAFILTSEEKGFLAMIYRPQPGDPELAVTVYADGSASVHRCEYILNNGEYVGTQVTCIKHLPAHPPLGW